jgi:predicted small lipoprotein YifL
MVRSIQGARFLSRYFDRPLFRLALIGLATALGLAACGRKGPLDPPPGASLTGEPQANMPDLMSKPAATPVGPDGQPLAPKGPKKHFPLDGLLN